MKSILIVEDERIVSMQLRMVLEKAGYYVIGSVASGVEAISACKNSDVCLVLMDIILEGDMDGIETMSRISEVNNSIRVVFLTANDTEDTKQRAAALKPSGFVGKPLRPDQVLHEVEKAFSL